MATTRQEGHTIVKNQRRATAFILAVAIFGDAAAVFAQNPAYAPAASPAAAPIVPSTMGEQNVVHLQVGRSAIVDVGSQIARVSLTSADVADAMVTTPRQLLVNGKLPGTISMFVWDKGGTLRRYEVNVGRNLEQLSTQMRQLFPGERVDVQNNGKNIVLSGSVSSKELAEKAVNVAAGYVEKKEEIVNLLQIRPPEASKQVLLRVRFAEVSRSAMTELGLSLAANGYKDGRWYGRSSTQQFAAPEWNEDGKFVFSDFLNLFLFDTKNQIAGVVKALQNKGLFQSLAEPNLVAESGKEASFLAGGEIPIPVVQGTGGAMAVSILWKEFGVRLSFTPQVTGDRVHLKVKPEVSTLDFNNAITLQGFRIPALSTRRTETELELQDGQTFAIAGLMNNSVSSTMQKIPGIGDIPILGSLFKSKAAQKDQTELVVMITPQILKTNSSGVTPDLPRTPEKFIEPLPENKLKDMPAPAFSGVRSAETPAVASAQSAKPSRGKGKSPENAAAALSSLVPAGPKVVNSPVLAVAPAASDPVVAAPTASVSAAVAPSPAPVTTAVAAPAKAEPVKAAKVEPVASALVPLPVEPAAADLKPVALESIDEDAPALAEAVAPVANRAPAAPAPSKDEAALLERAAREQQRREEALKKAEAADARQRAKQQAEADKKAGRERADAEKRAAELAKQDAEILRKQADAEKKRGDADAKKQAETSKKQNDAAKKQAAATQHDVLAVASTR